MQNFDKTAIFGKNQGINHSPHIQSQVNLDTTILLGLLGGTVLMLLSDFKRNGKMMNLRENLRTSGYGRFEADDFIVKKNWNLDFSLSKIALLLNQSSSVKWKDTQLQKRLSSVFTAHQSPLFKPK